VVTGTPPGFLVEEPADGDHVPREANRSRLAAAVGQGRPLPGSGRCCRRGNRHDVILCRLLPVHLHIVPAAACLNRARPGAAGQ
jgi:hypothetical protein